MVGSSWSTSPSEPQGHKLEIQQAGHERAARTAMSSTHVPVSQRSTQPAQHTWPHGHTWP
eukprot:1161024-Pelagomonas_calceolata.AAC.7